MIIIISNYTFKSQGIFIQITGIIYTHHMDIYIHTDIVLCYFMSTSLIRGERMNLGGNRDFLILVTLRSLGLSTYPIIYGTCTCG